MTQPRTTQRSHEKAEHRRHILQVAKVVSGTIGRDFFASMVRHLVEAFDADGAYIGELIDQPTARVKTLAAHWKNGQFYNSDQDLPGTAAGHILRDGDFSCGKNVTQLFPMDRLLETVHAQAYVGIHLSDSSAQTIGLLALIKSEPVSDPLIVKSVLEAFTPRASAELERKRADDRLKEDEERYRAFIASNPDGMWRVEFEEAVAVDLPEEEQIDRIYKFGYVAECNQAMCRLAGVATPEQLIGARLGDVAPRDDERILGELRSAVRSGFSNATVETRPLDESGWPLYRLRSQFCIVEGRELRRIWGTTRDITELRHAELAAAAADLQFRQTMETIRLPAVILARDGSPEFCNDCFLQMAHCRMEQVRSTRWLDGIVPDEERNLWKSALLRQIDNEAETFDHFESTIHAKEMPPRLIAWDTIPLRNAHGEFAGLAAIGQDITQQRALELEIRRTQKLEGIGHLASGVAHDLASILTVILGRTTLLLDETDKADSRYTSLRSIETAASDCAQLTKQLLAIGRNQDLHPSAISLNALVVNYESTLRDLIGPRVQLVIKLHPDSGSFYADSTQIQRVLANLVTNARDAMPDGGHLTISTSPVTVGGGQPMLGVKPGHYTQLSIADTGSGLTEEIQSHIFEPFFTTKPPGKGSGLGLSIVHGIVTQSGGHIRVHSQPSKGTTIELFFPCAEV